jgi:hypothetical protein
LTKRFLTVVGEGESEIRLMHDTPAFDARSTAEPEKVEQPQAAKAGANR